MRALLAVLLIGCSGPVEQTVSAPIELPVRRLEIQFEGRGEDRPAAEAAAGEWNAVCGTAIMIVDEARDHKLVFDEVTSDYSNWNYLAETIDHKRIIYRITTDTFRHEFGHLLGLEHTHNGSVMDYDSPVVPITTADCPHTN